MRIIYPYNEILPKRKAHDIFVFNECAALANQGQCDVTLIIGKGSSQDLFSHYNIPEHEHLHIKKRFIVRKNNPFGLSWNLPFFFLCQRYIQSTRPDFVICSVRKQAAYHFQRKIRDIQYVFEVHELTYYPNGSLSPLFQKEKEILAKADLITVTTEALKQILKASPYSLKNRIEVVPLAVLSTPLPPVSPARTLQLAYVGQLYAGQGLHILLTALSQTKNVHVKILGGSKVEIENFQKLARELSVEGAVTFLGFVTPSEIPSKIQDAHAFVAPFENTGRMPYVAHTKLFEYAHWGRPIIAPDLPIVREHFSTGTLFYEPDNPGALATSIRSLQQESTRTRLQEEVTSYHNHFSWTARAQAYTSLLKNNHTI